MKKLTFALLLFAALQAVAQQKNTDKRFKGLDTALTRVLKTWHVAGFAVAVVEKNKIIYAQGFGYSDLDKKLLVTPNTLFAIGSCSKAFTASMIGKLEADKKLDIDKPAGLYLPELRFYNDAMNNTITLRDMMSHKTGLPRYDLSWYFFNIDSPDSLVQRIQYMQPTFGVREKWQYNNFMFAAQGALIAHITGKSWGENIKANFFEPLGMSRSDVTIEEMEKTGDIATGYGLKHDSVIKKLDYYHIMGMSPAGAINSSANDMAQWVIAWINNGKYEGKEIIPKSFRDQAISSQSIIDGALPKIEEPGLYFANYGFGWFLSSYKGHYQVEHGGNIDGFSASTSFFPADSLGIIVLSNQNASAAPSIVRNIIADKLLKLGYDDWNDKQRGEFIKQQEGAEKVEKAKSKTVKHNPATHPLTDYAENYNNPAYGTFKLYIKNDSLFATTNMQTLWLRHNNYDIFDVFIKDPHEGIDTTAEAGIKLQFTMNTTGDIDAVQGLLEAGLKPIVFDKITEEKDISAAELQKYTGDYELPGLTVSVYIKDSKTLYAHVPGQADFELVYLGNDKFSLKILKGYYLQFDPAGAQKITGATFMQPNGNFAAKKK